MEVFQIALNSPYPGGCPTHAQPSTCLLRWHAQTPIAPSYQLGMVRRSLRAVRAGIWDAANRERPGSHPSYPPDSRSAIGDGCYSALNTRAVGVREAIRPGMAAARFARTSAPRATTTTSTIGTDGRGTA